MSEPSARCITAILRKLGRTPDEVAESLRVLGIKGRCPSTNRRANPLAAYLRSSYGLDIAVYHDPPRYRFEGPIIYLDENKLSAANQFLRLFQSCYYQFLILNPNPPF
jgi:hypothetical protein